jgi:hypothetical protein
MLILVTIVMIHIDNRPAMAATLFIFSTAVAVCLVLLMVYDRPFAVGGVTLAPTTFREIAWIDTTLSRQTFKLPARSSLWCETRVTAPLFLFELAIGSPARTGGN